MGELTNAASLTHWEWRSMRRLIHVLLLTGETTSSEEYHLLIDKCCLVVML